MKAPLSITVKPLNFARDLISQVMKIRELKYPQ